MLEFQFIKNALGLQEKDHFITKDKYIGQQTIYESMHKRYYQKFIKYALKNYVIQCTKNIQNLKSTVFKRLYGREEQQDKSAETKRLWL